MQKGTEKEGSEFRLGSSLSDFVGSTQSTTEDIYMMMFLCHYLDQSHFALLHIVQRVVISSIKESIIGCLVVTSLSKLIWHSVASILQPFHCKSGLKEMWQNRAKEHFKYIFNNLIVPSLPNMEPSQYIFSKESRRLIC